MLGALFLWRRVRRINPAIVHIHDPELLLTTYVLRMLGYKVIYDVHEDYPEKIREKGWIPRWMRGCVRLVFMGIESLSCRICSGVVAATDHIARRYHPGKTVVVRNYTMLNSAEKSSNEPHVSFVYAGVLSPLRGVREMLHAIELLDNDSVQLDIYGHFTDRKLRAWVSEYKTSANVNIHGWKERDEVIAHYSTSAAGLVLLHPTGTYTQSLPIKLFEYMASGLPVIASDFPYWRDIIESEQCGLMVDPLDTQAIADAMQWVMDNPDEAAEMGMRGRQAVADRYNWKSERKTLLALYQRVLLKSG